MLLTDAQAKVAGMVVAVALVLAGLIAIGLFAGTVSPHLTVFACALGFASASGAVGAIFGFIFGIPRTLTSDDGTTDKTVRSRIVPNTNLEQVSDWLTKILIGATLVELKSVPSTAANLFGALAPALGGQPYSAAFGGAIVVYFSVVGFLISWISTRTYLGQLLREADDVAGLLIQANAERDKDKKLSLLKEAAARLPG
jgi:hypothetical protein